MQTCYNSLSYTTGHGALFVSSAAGSTSDCWGKHPVLLDSRPAGCVATAAGSTGCFTMTAKDGKPCKRCGTSEWYKDGTCRQCARENSRRWYDANREKARENGRRWYRANRKQHREACHRWEKANPEKTLEAVHRRRARTIGNGGSYTVAEWREVVRQQGGRCLACGKKTKLTVDHVLPIALGGSNDISNIQGLCRSCNAVKNARHIDYRPGGKGIKRWIQKKLFDDDGAGEAGWGG